MEQPVYPATGDPAFNLTSGPAGATAATLAALGRPILHHLDPAFGALYQQTVELLRQAFGTRESPVILPGEAVVGLEAAAASLIGPGDVVLNLVSGMYGRGYGDWARRYAREIEVAYLGQAEVGGQPGHTEAAEVGGKRRHLRVDLGERLRVGDALLLHTEHADDEVAGLERVAVRLEHDAGRAGAHDLPEPDWRHVRRRVVHPAAHRRVERDLEDLDERLALAGAWGLLLRDLEVVRARLAHGALRET